MTRPPKRCCTLRTPWKSVEVSSITNGFLMVYPTWRIKRPGVLWRLVAAKRLQNFVNAHLKRRKG